MKTHELITKLQTLSPDADIVILNNAMGYGMDINYIYECKETREDFPVGSFGEEFPGNRVVLEV